MTIAASTIVDRAGTILQDTTSVRWPVAELVKWFNDAQREVVLLKPEASVTNTTLSLTQLSTKQSLPSVGIRLIDVIRNMGSAGSTPGSAIRLVMREIMDSQRPNWHTETAASVKHFMFDSRDPKNFYVYPAPSAALYVELIYSVAPTEVTESAGAAVGNLALDDVYANCILDYILYRAYSKDSEYAGNANRASAHYQAFSNSVGVRTTTDIDRSPNMHSPHNPNNPIQARGGA